MPEIRAVGLGLDKMGGLGLLRTTEGDFWCDYNMTGEALEASFGSEPGSAKDREMILEVEVGGSQLLSLRPANDDDADLDSDV